MKTKIKYLIPGAFVSEEETRTVKDRTVANAVANAPDYAFCFYFYDIEEPPDLGPDFKVAPVAKNQSGRYYLDAEVFKIDDIENLPDAHGHRILISNMRSNGWSRVLRCRTGNWQPLEDGDTLVNVKQYV